MIVSVTQVPRAKQTIRAGVKQWQSRMEMGKHDLVCHCSSSGIELLSREDTRRSFEETTTAGRQSLHVTKGDGCRLERNAMSKGPEKHLVRVQLEEYESLPNCCDAILHHLQTAIFCRTIT